MRCRIGSVLKRLFEFVVNWSTWRTVDRWRIVRTSYIWLFVVPLGAQLLGPFAGEHDITIPWVGATKTFHVTVDLPFSWKAFVAMAMSFALARVLFACRCPRIVAEYANFGEYRGQQSDSIRLIAYFEMVTRELPDPEFVRHASIALRHHPGRVAALSQRLEHGEQDANARSEISRMCRDEWKQRTLTEDAEGFSALFDQTRFDASIYTRRYVLFGVSGLYVFGLGALLWVVYENLRSLVLFMSA